MTTSIPLQRHRPGFFERYARRLLVAVSALAVVLAVVAITARHEARRFETEACAARLEVLKARFPRWQMTVPLADPCQALKALQG